MVSKKSCGERKYSEYDEHLRRQVTKVYDPPASQVSVAAFYTLSSDPNSFIRVSQWEEEMRKLGIELRNENGLAVKNYGNYTSF